MQHLTVEVQLKLKDNLKIFFFINNQFFYNTLLAQILFLNVQFHQNKIKIKTTESYFGFIAH